MTLISFAIKNGADDAAIETIKVDSTQIKFANSSICANQNWSFVRYNIFVSVNKSTAASTFHVLSRPQLESAIKNLILAAKKSKPSQEYSGLAKGPFKYKSVKNIYDKKILDYDGADAIENAIHVSNCKNAAGYFYKSQTERCVETSNGASGEEKKTNIQMSIRVFNKPDESGHFVSCSRVLRDFNPLEAGKHAGEIARLAKNPVDGKPSKYDIVFAPMAVGNILSRVGEFSTAFNVDSGFSCFAGKIEKKVANDIVTISDNGSLKGGVNSSLFDDEGVPTRETNIIERGILKTYLHNTSSAKKYKTKTTGNAGIISQRYNNIILKPGKTAKEKLLDIDNGLFITNVWYTRFQSYYSGDFSTIPRDGILVIKNGDFVGSVKNIRITENILNILNNVTNLSNKPECVQWWEEINPPVYTPYALVKSVNVTLPTM